MKEKINVLAEKAEHTMGRNADYLMVFNKNDNGGIAIAGDGFKIAKTIFTVLMQEDTVSPQLYSIIKEVVLNLLHNQTQYGKDLMQDIEHLSYVG